MKDIKRINLKFLLTIISFIVYIALSGFIVFISYYVFIFNPGIVYGIIFVLLLMLLFVTSIFRNKLDMLINTSYLIKIRHHQGEPLQIKKLFSEVSLQNYLGNNDFQLFSKDNDHWLFYKVTKDNIKKMFRGYILEVVVYVQKHQHEFYLDVVDEQIEKIQDILVNEHKKVDKLLISQIKIIEELDEHTKEQLKEIVFIRTQSGIVSTINIGIHLDSKKAVLLYSDNFSPSLYYKYHVNEIKKMI